ncbi:hypothetical protein B0H11DRAFT_27805 [Mycena galericulata]|nr:hypothetical protein B0H11DRAFT_27805 [Mycena galericulata]
MPPRPILKALPEPDLSKPGLPESAFSNPLPFAACSSRVIFSPHVHFPSTPGLTFTGATHSPGSYDRAPIAVSPNSCALPERGGRVYRSSSVPPPKGSYFHPRAFEACEAEPPVAVPALLPSDVSSETDEWDECASPPQSVSPEPRVAVRMPVQGTPYYPTPIPSTHSQEEFDHALSFLPYPPVPMHLPEKRRNSSIPRYRERPRRSMDSGFTGLGADSDGCLGGF